MNKLDLIWRNNSCWNAAISLGFIVEVHYVCINTILVIKYRTVTHDIKKILPRSEGCGGIIIIALQ